MSEEQNARDITDIRQNMVRNDVYKAEQAGVVKDVTENAKDILALEVKVDKAEERRAADRRLILTALVLPIVTALIILYITSQIGGQ